MTGCVGLSRGYSSAFQSACCVSVMFRVCVLMCTGYWCRSCGSCFTCWFTCSGTVTTSFVGRKAYFCRILCFLEVY